MFPKSPSKLKLLTDLGIPTPMDGLTSSISRLLKLATWSTFGSLCETLPLGFLLIGIAVADSTSLADSRRLGSFSTSRVGCDLRGTSGVSCFEGRMRIDSDWVSPLVGEDSRDRKNGEERGDPDRGEFEGDRELR